jgi:hypothetical protein
MRRILAIGLAVAMLGFPDMAWGIRGQDEDGWTGNWDANNPTPKDTDKQPAPSRIQIPKIPLRSPTGTSPARGTAPLPMRRATEDPDAIGVVITNSTYRNGIPTVDYARNDGQAAQALMRDVFGLRPGNILVLEDAGQADLLTMFGNASTHEGKLWSWIRPGRSKVYVYYSGHGVPGLRDGRAYLLPVDADPGTAEINGYPLELLYRNLEKLGVKSVTVILESCFSGMTERGSLIRSASPVFVKSSQPTAGSGMTVLSAAQGDQIASWDHGAGLGMFTNYLMRALYGEADGGRWGDGDGKVSLGELEAYLDDEMTYAARREYRRVQQSSLTGDRQMILASAISSDPGPRKPARGLDRSAGPSSASISFGGALPKAAAFVVNTTFH